MKRLAILAFLMWLCPAMGTAQDHLAHGASGLSHGIPDFCASASERLVVPAGQSRTISGRFETSCLGVHGTLVIASGTTVRVDELLIYADGTLLVGSPDQPATGVEIIIRDRPLDLARDPEQFGQGIIGFGRVSMYGQPPNGPTRSIAVRSEKPDGASRGHVLFTQRADVDIRYVAFLDLGRTSALRPLDSTTFSGNIASRTGTNQIGRYSLHLHHVFGPLPVKSDRQFRLIGNLIQGDSKWGIAIHNSHFGLIQDNVCVDAIGACYVEEEGSETDNHWIGNYAGRIRNDSTNGMDPRTCVDHGYDPEGRCASGFWLRGINNVLVDNVVEDARVGIGWWTVCLESQAMGCSAGIVLTVPAFPGADTTDLNQRAKCSNGGVNSDTNCYVGLRTGLKVDGNVIRRTLHGLEHWWTQRIQLREGLKGSPPITNTTMEDVDTPLHQNYSDVAYDGLNATRRDYRGVAWGMFNDGQPIGLGQGYNTLRRAVIRGYEYCWSKMGQLDHPPFLMISDSVCQSAKGINLIWGGQGYGDTQEFHVTNTRFEAPPGQSAVAFTASKALEGAASQRIRTTVTGFQGNATDTFTITSPNEASPCQTTRPEVVGAFTCPGGTAPPSIPTPTPPPPLSPLPGSTPPAIPAGRCRFPIELGLCN
jgi:hypothetical protein